MNSDEIRRLQAIFGVTEFQELLGAFLIQEAVSSEKFWETAERDKKHSRNNYGLGYHINSSLQVVQTLLDEGIDYDLNNYRGALYRDRNHLAEYFVQSTRLRALHSELTMKHAQPTVLSKLILSYVDNRKISTNILRITSKSDERKLAIEMLGLEKFSPALINMLDPTRDLTTTMRMVKIPEGNGYISLWCNDKNSVEEVKKSILLHSLCDFNVLYPQGIELVSGGNKIHDLKKALAKQEDWVAIQRAR